MAQARPDEVTGHTPVRARVLVAPGLGALWGLAAGDALGRRGVAGPGVIDDASALSQMFMARGAYVEGEPVRPSGCLDAVAALARCVPIALFYGGAPEERVAATLSDVGTADLRTALACVAFNGAIARAVFGGAAAAEQLAQAIADIDAALALLLERSPARTEDARAAGRALHDALRSAFDNGVATWGDATSTVASALMSVLNERDPEATMAALLDHEAAGSSQAAALGALYGANLGRDALPASWLDAARAIDVEALADFVQAGPFLGWG